MKSRTGLALPDGERRFSIGQAVDRPRQHDVGARVGERPGDELGIPACQGPGRLEIGAPTAVPRCAQALGAWGSGLIHPRHGGPESPPAQHRRERGLSSPPKTFRNGLAGVMALLGAWLLPWQALAQSVARTLV